MNKTIYKITPHILASAAVFAAGTYVAHAADTQGDITTYIPLTTIPGVFTAGTPTNPVAIIKGFYGIAIGVGSIIAVVMIVLAGFKYMYEESMSGKSGAKEQIENAFLGLLVILGSYILLRTVNADLVNFNPILPGGTGRVSGLVAADRVTEAAVKKALADNDARAQEISTLKTSLSTTDTKLADLKSQLTIAELQNSFKPSPEVDAKIKDLKDQIAKTQTDRDAAQSAVNIKIVDDLSKKTDNTMLAINNSLENEWSNISTKSVANGNYGTTLDESTLSLDTISAKIGNQITVANGNIEKMAAVPIYGDATDPDVKSLDVAIAKAKQDVTYLQTSQSLMNVYKSGLANAQTSGVAGALETSSIPFSQAYDSTLKRVQDLRTAGRDDLAEQLTKDLTRATDIVKSSFKYLCSQSYTPTDKSSFICKTSSGS